MAGHRAGHAIQQGQLAKGVPWPWRRIGEPPFFGSTAGPLAPLEVGEWHGYGWVAEWMGLVGGFMDG